MPVEFRPNPARHIPDGFVALVFLAAAALKIWDPPGFALAIARLELAPRGLIGPAAILLPWIELAAGLALLLPSWRASGRVLAGGLLALFSVVLAVALVQGSASSCGCFGADGGFFSRLDVGLVRNLLLGGLLALSCRRSEPASPASATPR